MMKVFLDLQFPPLLYPDTLKEPLLLVFDSARSHLAASVKSYLKDRNILFLVIPGGMTPLLQPADVCWFRPLKRVMAAEVRQWLDSNPPRTRSGNIRSPDVATMASWLSKAQQSLTPASISHSFQSCFLGPLNQLHIAQKFCIWSCFSTSEFR
ncbi:hypothetical protein GEMRC1_011249 [Eukaryota sp. GEM-RC1]